MSNMEILNQVITVKEASETFGVSIRQIQKLCKNKKISSRKSSSTWLILKSSAKQYFIKKSE